MEVKFHQDHQYKQTKKSWIGYVEMVKQRLHPSCSAKMGPASDPMSVVDPLTMKVHGMENLRVVDASAMPRTTNGNIHAPVLMLEKEISSVVRNH